MMQVPDYLGNQTVDTQAIPAPTELCFICEERVPVWELDEGIDDPRGPVCRDCSGEWAKIRINENPDYIKGYIAANEYAFYKKYWFDFLDHADQLLIIRSAYQLAKRLGGKDLERQEKEFCLDSDYFPDWVKEQ